jgi:hypothetical protein
VNGFKQRRRLSRKLDAISFPNTGTGRDAGIHHAKTARCLAHNVVWMARVLKAHPIPTNLRQLVEEAAAVSR